MLRMKIRAAGLIPALFAGVLLSAMGAAAQALGPAEIREIAADLVNGLDSAKMSSVPTNGAFDEITVKIAAYQAGDEDRPNVGQTVRAISLQLTAEMQARYGERYRFISAEAQEALLTELTGETGASRDRAAREIEARAKPDVLIRPVVLTMSSGTYLTYQAIAAFGAEILATSQPIAVAQEIAATVVSADFQPGGGSDGIYRPVALEAERLLLAHGYDPGEIDGYIDDDLRRALRAYQSNSALYPNGRLTWETVENLRRDRRNPQ